MADSDMIKLYSARILALAADIPNTGSLEHADARVRKRSPLCGSTITVAIQVKNGRIVDFSQDVKACALGQAAASVVGGHIIGCTRAQVTRARDQLKAMLKSNGPAPDAPFDGLAVLEPAREYKNRHASIMLALEASTEAFCEAEKSACA